MGPLSRRAKGSAMPEAGELCAFEALDREGLLVTSEGRFVRYLRVTLNAPQVPAPFTDHCPTDPTGTVFSGCTYMVLTELEAFGPAM